ncbi:LuxR family transcriptional regulator [Crossiella cryophila]
MQATMTPLVGRESALADLRRALSNTVAGSGRCVVIEGSAGIGKSRLLEVVSSDAAGQGISVAFGRATELDKGAPLTTLRALLTGLPGLERIAMHDLERNALGLVDRVGELIEKHVRDRPLLIGLDDAHCSDELTAFALRILVPALSTSPVLWLLARRPAPVRGYAQDALDWLISEGAQRHHLGPLCCNAVADLCANVLGAHPDAKVLALAARAEGNPFLLEELLITLRDTGQLLTAEGTATVVGNELTPPFLSAVDHRLRDLSSEARRLLDAGAVLGRPFTVHEVAALLCRSATELLPVISEAVDAGILVGNGSELTFRHDLIREALYNRLPGPVRMALHREAAFIVLGEGRSPADAVEHLVRSGHKGDAQAVLILRQAVREVAPTSPNTAADLILRMLDLIDEQHASRPQLVGDAVRLLALAGRAAEAIRLGESSLRTVERTEDKVSLLLGLSEALYATGRNSSVVEYTSRALARARTPSRARAELLAMQAYLLIDSGDPRSADAVAAEAVAIGVQAGEYAAVVCGNNARSVVARVHGQLDVALTYAREAVRVADKVGGSSRSRHPRLWLAVALTASDRFEEAEAGFARDHQDTEAAGTALSQPHWHYYRAELRLAQGRLDDAAVEAEAGVFVAEQLRAQPLAVPLLAMLGLISVYRDDMTMARSYLKQADGLVDEGVSVVPEDLAWAAACFQDAAGHQEAALEILDELSEALPERLLLFTRHPAAGARLIRMAQQTGDHARAELVVRATRKLAERNPEVASAAGAAAHAEGVLRNDIGLLRAAVGAYRATGRQLSLAEGLEDLAHAEDAAGHRATAVGLMQEAAQYFTACGAKRDLARVQKALRRLGVRRRIAAKPVKGGSGWNSLTQSELRVVRLVAEGFTNREVAGKLFLSPHTVDSHLRHSFAKLGVTSRVELTRKAMSHDESR